MEKLPLNYSDFKKIRNLNCIYVDKTDFIAKLIKNSSCYFISRPRGFGKSTLISTLKVLFEKGLDEFADLKIGKYSKEELNLTRTYKVLRLTLSTYERSQGSRSLEEHFMQKVRCFFEDLGIVIDERFNTLSSVFEAGLEKLDDEIVLLIDDYDAPFIANLDFKYEFNKLKSIFTNFYQVVQAFDGKFRFVFITGIMRFFNTEVMPGFVNFKDISFDEDFGEFLGFSEDEFMHYFANHLGWYACALNRENETDRYTVTTEYNRVKDRYFGYSFDKKVKTHVYNPISVLNYLEKPQDGPAYYWCDTEKTFTPSLKRYVLRKLQANNMAPFDFSAISEKCSIEELTINIDELPYEPMKLVAILYQAGYFTLQSVDDDGVTLAQPSYEVSAQFAKACAYFLFRKGSQFRPIL